MLLNKYFPFGQGQGQINIKFIWGDSFAKQVVASPSALFDALSSKYNYAVCLARIACYMNLEGDGIKYACKYMQQAAWVFDSLKNEVGSLKPGETGPDFTSEVLSMLAALCLAQGQYLFYKLATEKKQSAEMLAKVSTKISEYFKEANGFAAMNKATVAF